MFVIAGKNPGNKTLLTIIVFLYLVLNIILPVIYGTVYLRENNKPDQILWFYGSVLMLRIVELFFAKGQKTFTILWKSQGK